MEARGNPSAATVAGRQNELSVLTALAAGARAGRPAAALLRGPAGIGRSALLDAFLLESGRQATVLRARCSEASRASGQLTLRSLLAGLGTEGPGTADAVAELESGSTAYGPLAHWHRVVTGLLEKRPVIIAIDDVHRCDRQSLRSVAFTLRRAAGLPLLVVLSAPTGTILDADPALAELLTQDHWHTVNLAALTPDAVAAVVRRRLGGRATGALNRTCFEVSQGNPGLLNALLDEVCAKSEPARLLVPVGRQLAEDALLADLRQLPQVLPVAVASAVLGTTSARLVGGLSGLPIPSVLRALEQLRVRRALSPDGSRLASETLRLALLSLVGPEELARQRIRAAQLLEDAGRPLGEVAEVLLKISEPSEPWMVNALHGAARMARLRGESATAVRYLTHALRLSSSEPTSVSRTIHSQAAGLLATTDPSSALRHLRRLLALDPQDASGPARAPQGVDRSVGMGRVRQSVRLLAQVLDEPDGAGDSPRGQDGERRTLLDAALLLSGGLDRSTISWVHDRSVVTPTRHQHHAGDEALTNAHALLSTLGGAMAAAVAEQAKGTPGPSAAPGPPTGMRRYSVIASALMLHLADQSEPAIVALDHLLAPGQGEERGSGYATALTARAAVRYGIGDLDEARADAQHAVRIRQQPGWRRRTSSALTALAAILTQQGDTTGAEQVLRLIDRPGYRDSLWEYPTYLWTRAALERQRGDLEAALSSLYACGGLLREAGVHNPVFLPWWTEAAGVLAALGRPSEAREAAAYGEEVAERWGTPRSIGLALLARGLAAGDRTGTDLLTEACDVLACSPARLACAQAEHALGTALLRDDNVHKARLHLRRAFDLSVQCGAAGLGSTVRDLLVATGGRVRPMTGSRADTLTESERRVAALAAEGRSNREIAEILFVALRTVELHLTNAYRKLGISRRSELAAVFDGGIAERMGSRMSGPGMFGPGASQSGASQKGLSRHVRY
ncbi:regulatory LuxR family protein [Streptomyces sp. 846.5]|nr:regulatory LuxR family protein [Streptomyces sp. 846.5]